jgi:large subunit ribosomal protein L4
LRNEALKGVLGDKIRGGKLLVVDSLAGESGKTKDAAAWLKKIGAGSKPLIAAEKFSGSVNRAMRNIRGVAMRSVSALNAYEILAHDTLVVTRDGFNKLQERLKK